MAGEVVEIARRGRYCVDPMGPQRAEPDYLMALGQISTPCGRM
jgi:hypothetical protein